ncbi:MULTISPECIES: hypothetical protein [Priestia]|jgi:flagellar basal body-associated protein FliL|uniref:Uncharacterized protein n=3 Tax=Priestia TaxID=2800373 RepID=A0A0H4KG55_9BACI|nr:MULTISPECIES: hypothetical protein [Priestia]AKO91766.1 hypothetical protein BEH_06400 [Priestia filamentosa]KAB2490358.1 hypothetical protein F8155_21315 [Priestia endophytica]KYG31657.1 hypothetical protein AZF06_07950 [Priestia endophytica]MBG9811485.1 hypothetical protein [Priestia endophytica]MCM3537109.1 hypothetical protein [Priestia endophytica]
MNEPNENQDEYRKGKRIFWLIWIVPIIGALVVAAVAFLMQPTPNEKPRDIGPPAPKVPHEQSTSYIVDMDHFHI